MVRIIQITVNYDTVTVLQYEKKLILSDQKMVY